MDIPVHVRYLQVQIMPGIYSSITIYRSAHRTLYYDGTGKAGGEFVSLDDLKRAWQELKKTPGFSYTKEDYVTTLQDLLQVGNPSFLTHIQTLAQGQEGRLL